MSSNTSTEPITKALKLHGRVQGVGFRWWTRKQATQLGIRGSVRNCPDGTVDVKMGGPAQQLQELEDRLRQGPPAARVSRIEEMEPPRELPEEFEIAH